MSVFYEEITISDYLQNNDCFSLSNLEMILPLGKPLKINKPVNMDVYFVKDGRELFGPLRTGSVSPLEHSSFKVMEKIKGNLSDSQILIVD